MEWQVPAPRVKTEIWASFWAYTVPVLPLPRDFCANRSRGRSQTGQSMEGHATRWGDSNHGHGREPRMLVGDLPPTTFASGTRLSKYSGTGGPHRQGVCGESWGSGIPSVVNGISGGNKCITRPQWLRMAEVKEVLEVENTCLVFGQQIVRHLHKRME